jgi:glycosyltransferase involved in cell wall biosynthesis
MMNPSSLRVLIATPFGAQQRGGIDRLTDLLIDSMAARPDLDIAPVRLVTRGPGSLAVSPLIFARALVQLVAARRRGEASLIHINLAAGGSAWRKALLARAARRLKIPYVVHLHGSRFNTFWPSAGPRTRAAVDRLFRDSAGIIVLGRYWAELIAGRLPELRDRIVILPNATAPAPHREPAGDGPVHIAFLGELGPRKGTPQLVEALGRLAGRAGWRATLAGNGEIEAARQRADALGIAGRTDFPGWLDAEGVNAVLRQADVLVLPSFAENLPMAILEAFARGIAVVATPVGAVPEVIDHERNGLLVPVGDVEALAAALARLIDDTALRQRLGAAAARDHAERYEVSAYVRRMAAIWRRAAGPKAPQPVAGVDAPPVSAT